MKESESGIVKSVLKALAALEFVNAENLSRDGVGLAEIAAALNLQATTTRNLLKTLEQAGYLARTGNRLYAPGPKCRELARGAVISAIMHRTAAKVLAVISRETGESTVLTTLLNGRRKVLLRQQGSASVVVASSSTEQEKDGYALVTTRILLAYASASEVDAFVANYGWPLGEWDNILDRQSLNAAIDKIRNSGYVESIDSETAALAVPVLSSGGELLGALGIYLPKYRFTPEVSSKLLGALQAGAQKIV